MGVRHVPELTFAIDRTEKLGTRMNELLGRIDKQRAKLKRKGSGTQPGQEQELQPGAEQ